MHAYNLFRNLGQLCFVAYCSGMVIICLYCEGNICMINKSQVVKGHQALRSKGHMSGFHCDCAVINDSVLGFQKITADASREDVNGNSQETNHAI